MRWAPALAVVVVAAALAFSGGTTVDPPVPRGFPGVLPAFFAGAAGGGTRSSEGWKADPGAARRRDRRWLRRSQPLSASAPSWARRMYRRSLLVLRAATDPRSGAVVAGPRPGWSYVWPRDAGAVAIALAEAGYGREARRISRFLGSLDLGAAARFGTDGEPVPGRPAQGDAAGWVAAAGRAAGLRSGALSSGSVAWRDRADYQEGDSGDYLGNAIASGAGLGAFVTADGLVRDAGDPGSGRDTAAAWAVRPFARRALFPVARRTLLRLVAARRSPFGLLPSESWHGGNDPWTAPTAWTAWSLAALARIDRNAGRPRAAMVNRRAALSLMADLRRDATRRGLLPERVDADTGAPASTTPLAWSHAFAVLAIRELWRRGRR